MRKKSREANGATYLKKNILLFALLSLGSSRCEKEDDDCHYKIVLYNRSDRSIAFAHNRPLIFENGDSLCTFIGIQIDPNGVSEYRPFNSCIERSIGDRIMEFYVTDVDSSLLDTSIACDKLMDSPEILQRYEYDLTQLEAVNFEIVFEE